MQRANQFLHLYCCTAPSSTALCWSSYHVNSLHWIFFRFSPVKNEPVASKRTRLVHLKRFAEGLPCLILTTSGVTQNVQTLHGSIYIRNCFAAFKALIYHSISVSLADRRTVLSRWNIPFMTDSKVQALQEHTSVVSDLKPQKLFLFVCRD